MSVCSRSVVIIRSVCLCAVDLIIIRTVQIFLMQCVQALVHVMFALYGNFLCNFNSFFLFDSFYLCIEFSVYRDPSWIYRFTHHSSQFFPFFWQCSKFFVSVAREAGSMLSRAVREDIKWRYDKATNITFSPDMLSTMKTIQFQQYSINSFNTV